MTKNKILKKYQELFGELLNSSERGERAAMFTEYVMSLLFREDAKRAAKERVGTQWQKFKKSTNYTKKEFYKENYRPSYLEIPLKKKKAKKVKCRCAYAVSTGCQPWSFLAKSGHHLDDIHTEQYTSYENAETVISFRFCPFCGKKIIRGSNDK